MLTNISSNRFEFRLLLSILVLVNLGLLIGNAPSLNLSFDPSAVMMGEWWRLLTWPFVHVSRYHLLLDASAFLLLYFGLSEQKLSKRAVLLSSTISGSLLLPMALDPQIYQIGLSGLSGIAHGFMGILALEMISNRQKALGWTLYGGLILKVMLELESGAAFLSHFHFGDVGCPLVTTHAGGVLGGTVGYLLLMAINKTKGK